MKYSFENNTCSIAGHYSELLELYKQHGCIPGQGPWKTQCGPRNVEHSYGKNEPNWHAGTVQDLDKAPDMTQFNSKLETIRNNPALSLFKPGATMAMHARKRIRSEHDGDYDLDKRWEIKPFNATYKAPTVKQYIAINADMSINCMYGASQINDYGATVWAIVQALENRGIAVGVNVVNFAQHSTGVNSKYCITVKEPLKYTSPGALASVFTANFFRRCLFFATSKACDEFNKDATSTLGRPVPPKGKVTAMGNTLTLSIGAINDLKAVEKALAQLLKANQEQVKQAIGE